MLYSKIGKKFGRRATASFTNTERKAAKEKNTTLDVVGLRMAFTIRKRDKGASNTAVIKVFNMAPESREFLEVKPTMTSIPRIVVELEVGYEHPITIFLGRCTAQSEYVSPNWVTTLIATDGQAHFVQSYDKKFAKGTSIQNIVRSMLHESGITLRRETIGAIDRSAKLPRSRTFTGPPLMNIESLQKQYGFNLNIQDDIAIIKNTAVDLGEHTSETFIVLNWENGLLTQPTRNGLFVYTKSLIFPEIKPGTILSLTDEGDFRGTYYKKRCDIIGDTWGGPWQMNCQLRPTGEGKLYYSGDGGTINA